MDRNDLITTLQNEANLKHWFNKEDIAILAQHMSVKTFDDNAILMRKDEPADCMAFLVSGRVQIIEDERQIALLTTGDCFGESMFSEEATRVASVQALETTKVGWFTIHDFHTLLETKQRLALQFREVFKAVGRARTEQHAAETYTDKRKYLALIAHNNMKESLMEFCSIHTHKLEQFPLIATGTTGSMLFKKTGMCLSRKVASGPLGGDQAVGTLISTQNIIGVIFFRDPLSSHPHHADIEALGRLCDVYQIPLATNPQSGEAILDYLLSGKADHQLLPNRVLESYVKGQKKVVEAG